MQRPIARALGLYFVRRLVPPLNMTYIHEAMEPSYYVPQLQRAVASKKPVPRRQVETFACGTVSSSPRTSEAPQPFFSKQACWVSGPPF